METDGPLRPADSGALGVEVDGPFKPVDVGALGVEFVGPFRTVDGGTLGVEVGFTRTGLACWLDEPALTAGSAIVRQDLENSEQADERC